MNTQEQAFLTGYLKRAAELGATERQAVELYKRAGGYNASNDPNFVPTSHGAINNRELKTKEYAEAAGRPSDMSPAERTSTTAWTSKMPPVIPPATPHGKILNNELPAGEGSKTAPASGGVAPGSPQVGGVSLTPPQVPPIALGSPAPGGINPNAGADTRFMAAANRINGGSGGVNFTDGRPAAAPINAPNPIPNRALADGRLVTQSPSVKISSEVLSRMLKNAGGLPTYQRSTSPASVNRYLPPVRPAMDVAPAPVGGYRPTPDEGGYKQIRNIAPMTAGPAPAVQAAAPNPPAGLIASR